MRALALLVVQVRVVRDGAHAALAQLRRHALALPPAEAVHDAALPRAPLAARGRRGRSGSVMRSAARDMGAEARGAHD